MCISAVLRYHEYLRNATLMPIFCLEPKLPPKGGNMNPCTRNSLCRYVGLAGLWVVCVLASVHAAHYWVSPDGDDGADGSLGAPLKTIRKAGEVALNPGDIVTVKPGVYQERVRVHGEGTPEAPIVFESEEPHGAVLNGSGIREIGFVPADWAGVDDNGAKSGNHWVTIRGFAFEELTWNEGDSIEHKVVLNTSTGWVVEACTFNRVYLALNIRGHKCVVRDCLFEDLYSHALVACYAHGILIKDVTIRNGNLNRERVSNSAVNKFLKTDSCIVDNVLSEGHVGPGWWFDALNTNFTIRNCTIRNCRGNSYDWEGPGMWLEINPESKSTVYNNEVTGCAGAGICFMESQDIECFNNYVAGNGFCVEFRNMPDRTGFLANIDVHDNVFADWRNAAVTTSIGEWNTSVWTPQEYNITVDNNFYCPPDGEPFYSWVGQELNSLGDVTQTLGFDANSVVDCNADIKVDVTPQAAVEHTRPRSAPTTLHILFRGTGGLASARPSIIYDLRGRMAGTTSGLRDAPVTADGTRCARGAYPIRNLSITE
ncbi:MAG: hypothetical protein GF418_13325 [Chitinivibrionales bacterium]|nr:hypothetical protein [Chitinivibrionales bacterium]MBD3396600.1 hypothetical protein [Chitinivibrionales bacterium]